MKKSTLPAAKLVSLTALAAAVLFLGPGAFAQDQPQPQAQQQQQPQPQQQQAPINLQVNPGPVYSQVNNQVNPQVNQQNDARLVPLIGAELYGNTTGLPGGGMRYGPQSSYLPSEVRYAQERSGALPSEIRLNTQSVGPLAPNGPISYIPQQSAIQQINHATPPQFLNPAYRNQPQYAPGNGNVQGQVTSPAPQPQFTPATGGYILRPQVQTPNTFYPPTRRFMPATPPTVPGDTAAAPMVQLPMNAETLRYLARLEAEKEKAATQPSQAPTTLPSSAP